MSNNLYPELVTPPNEVKLPFVRTGLHSYRVRYSYYTTNAGRRYAEGRDEVRMEVTETVEAWSAADAVVQVAILADGQGKNRCKILQVTPEGK